ncbi:MAG: hypothetical protein KU38_09980 [Sulfurovum sp. FS08-3]|nr:MAG: hypothetical protein KU38_09980 [Sulfurovum sp. FS08-3]
MRSVIILLLIVLVASCGYKPTAHYTHKVLGKDIYIDVMVDRMEPESSVYIKDKLATIIYQRFHGRLSPKATAQSTIEVSYGSTITPLSYDANGFVTKYRINLAMTFNVKSKIRGNFVKRIDTSYESDIEQSGKNQSALRIEAIKEGATIALDEFVAYIATLGTL